MVIIRNKITCTVDLNNLRINFDTTSLYQPIKVQKVLMDLKPIMRFNFGDLYNLYYIVSKAREIGLFFFTLVPKDYLFVDFSTLIFIGRFIQLSV